MARNPSFPVTLAVDWHSGTSYVNIGQIRDVSGPGISRNSIEVPADHDATNNYLEFFPGMTDPGEITFDINVDFSGAVGTAQVLTPAGTSILGSFKDDYNCSTLPGWRYRNTGICAGTADWTFEGFVTGFEYSGGAVEGSVEASVTVKISGEPTLSVS
jgi:hypothetical protein